MTPELSALAAAILLQMAQLALMSLRANLELKPGQTLSPRDPERLGAPLEQQVSRGTGRLFRAVNNHFEALTLFAPAVVIVALADRSTAFTAAMAWTYVGARLLYVPAYFFGLVPWRSVIWAVGFLATFLMLAATLI